jgi:hypothetical protein
LTLPENGTNGLPVLTGNIPYALSPRRQPQYLSSDTYRLLAKEICLWYPLTPIHCCSDAAVTSNSLPLDRKAIFFEYIIVNGKCYYASQTVGWNKSSFVQVVILGSSSSTAYGEVLEIFQFSQDFGQIDCPLWLAQVCWLMPWEGECDSLWVNL